MSRLFAGVWRTIALLYALVLLVILIVVPVGVYLAFFSGPHVSVAQGSALVWAPTGDLVEQRSGVSSLVGSVLSPAQPEAVVHDLIESLDRAGDDDRIKLAFLKLDQLGAAQPGQIQDLLAAIDRFKQSGKPVIAWSPSYDQAQYELASHADKIYLDPLGYVFLSGYGVYRNYFKDALDTLGVTINVFRVGEYKSFVEPFTRNEMSPAARAANKSWMNSLWGIYRDQVAAQREISADGLSDYIDGFATTLSRLGGDAARMAQKAGLVDEIAPIDTVRQAMIDRVGRDDVHGSFRQIDQSDYLAASGAETAAPRTGSRLAMVVVEGAIVDGESVPDSAGGDTVARLLGQARRDDHVAAVLLRVNSPGGSITASEHIRRAVAAVREAGKPVVVSMAGTAASGGYWISMDADQIWAEPSTITGSIGVFGILPTISKPLNDLGIHTDGVGTTPLAGALRIDKPLSPQIKTMLQAGIEHAYGVFVSKVAQARGMQEDAVRRIAEGRVWSGADAQRLGLVDKLGSFTQAKQATAQLAGLKPGDYTLETMRPPSDWQAALQRLLSAHARSALVPDWLAGLTDTDALGWLSHGANDPHHLYAHCFCALDRPAGALSALSGTHPE